MLVKTGFLFLLAAALQVSADYVIPDFVEKLRENEVEAYGEQRIVSGWVAIRGQHPHHAALRTVDTSGGVSGCGGSIVHTNWVLTAAHCTALRVTVVVRGGVVSLTNPEYIFETTEWYNHPTYNNMIPNIVQPNDISLLHLQQPFVFSDYMKPIRIQPSSEAFKDYDAERLHASGHGLTWTGGSTTEILNWVYLTGVANLACRNIFGPVVTDNTICARYYNVTSQSTCSGDSGGPLVHVNADGEPILIGVASFAPSGTIGCHSGYPAGFIRPGPFLSWFEEVSGIDFEKYEGTTEPPQEDETRPPQDEDAQPPQDEDDSDSDEDDNDEELSQLLKQLQIKVNVKVNINKYGHKVEKEVDVEKEVNKHQ